MFRSASAIVPSVISLESTLPTTLSSVVSYAPVVSVPSAIDPPSKETLALRAPSATVDEAPTVRVFET